MNKGYLTAQRTIESDEVATPINAVVPIVKHLQAKGFTTVWCPFDESHSYFVKVLSNSGFKVIYSHIKTGQDFFKYYPNEPFDVIVSNPPFSIKDCVIKRLYELNKPFAMLMPLPALQGQKRFAYFQTGLELLVFDKRINFVADKNNSFASIYFCKDVLNHPLIFEKLSGDTNEKKPLQKDNA